MKFLAAFIATCALTQTALAQTPECRSLPDPGQRLACYDMAAPPASAGDKMSAKRAGTAKRADSKPDPSTSKDIDAEDALMNARMKSICRGC